MDDAMEALSDAFGFTGVIFVAMTFALLGVAQCLRHSKAAYIIAAVTGAMTFGLFITAVWVGYLAQVV